MKVTMKTWGTLGLATALAGAGLAGCAGEEGSEGGEAAQAGDAASAGEGGEGEGGEGEGGEGEGGEGGVSIAAASSDPVVYGSALAIVEAHAIAARDAYLAGKIEPAAEMFGHPVSEVLADMDPVFEERGVADFKSTLNDASATVLDGGDADAVQASYDAIITALRGAAEKAPTSDKSEGAIAAGIVSDMIERAAGMYGEAMSSERYEPYLDGYGFYKAGAAAFAASDSAIKAENADLHGDIAAALGLLETAYPSAERPAELEANQGQLSAASSKVLLAL